MSLRVLSVDVSCGSRMEWSLMRSTALNCWRRLVSAWFLDQGLDSGTGRTTSDVPYSLKRNSSGRWWRGLRPFISNSWANIGKPRRSDVAMTEKPAYDRRVLVAMLVFFRIRVFLILNHAIETRVILSLSKCLLSYVYQLFYTEEFKISWLLL